MVDEIGRVVVGSILRRARTLGPSHYGNFDPSGRGTARGRAPSHLPAPGGVTDFARRPTDSPRGTLSVAARLEETLTFGQGPNRWRRPLLSHIKQFARECPRFLSASTRRAGAGRAIVDAPIIDVCVRRAFAIVTFARDAGIGASCHHNHGHARPVGTRADSADAGVSCIRRTPFLAIALHFPLGPLDLFGRDASSAESVRHLRYGHWL
jgi:hypothetical protein